jgi:hypothetical protein
MAHRRKDTPRPDNDGGGERGATTVRSDHAQPTRPGGYEGVRSPMSATPPHPPDATPADAALAQAIVDAIEADGRLASGRIEVSVDRGLVRLRGNVGTEFQRQLAIALAETVVGVLLVESALDLDRRGPMDKDAVPGLDPAQTGNRRPRPSGK